MKKDIYDRMVETLKKNIEPIIYIICLLAIFLIAFLYGIFDSLYDMLIAIFAFSAILVMAVLVLYFAIKILLSERLKDNRLKDTKVADFIKNHTILLALLTISIGIFFVLSVSYGQPKVNSILINKFSIGEGRYPLSW